MAVEWASSVLTRARLHAALGEPARLAIVDRLVLGDVSPGELAGELGLASNLLAHHVALLERAGLVVRSRSEGDRRRTYLRLRAGALEGLVPAVRRVAPRVLFVCTHNSARSQLAAALWRARSPVPAISAGTRPAARVHPLAVSVGRRHGLSLTRARTAHVEQVMRADDLVIAVCDGAHEQLAHEQPAGAAGMAGGVGGRLHWSVPDPARSATAGAFEHALADLADRIDRLAPAVRPAGSDEPATG